MEKPNTDPLLAMFKKSLTPDPGGTRSELPAIIKGAKEDFARDEALRHPETDHEDEVAFNQWLSDQRGGDK